MTPTKSWKSTISGRVGTSKHTHTHTPQHVAHHPAPGAWSARLEKANLDLEIQQLEQNRTSKHGFKYVHCTRHFCGQTHPQHHPLPQSPRTIHPAGAVSPFAFRFFQRAVRLVCRLGCRNRPAGFNKQHGRGQPLFVDDPKTRLPVPGSLGPEKGGMGELATVTSLPGRRVVDTRMVGRSSS